MSKAKSSPYSITQLGNAALEQRATEVESILSDDCQTAN
jgi:hypothetical protein